MLHTRTRISRWAIDVFEEAASPNGCSQDATLLACRGDAVRVAAIDGCTPTSACEPALGLDGAAYAAQITRAALSGPAALRDATLRAHEALHDPLLDHVRDGRQAMMVAAEITPDGTVEAVRCDDCELWVLAADRGWQRLFESGVLSDNAEATVQELQRRFAGRGATDEVLRAEEEALADPRAWQWPPVGRYPHLPIDHAVINGQWSQLILASDGARLTAQRCADLERWLAGLRAFERDSAPVDFKRHDDVSVIRIRAPRGRPAMPAAAA